MPKLPRVTVAKMMRALKRAGFVIARQKGGHAFLVNPATGARCVVPQHVGDLKVGITAGILRQAGIPRHEFARLLRGKR